MSRDKLSNRPGINSWTVWLGSGVLLLAAGGAVFGWTSATRAMNQRGGTDYLREIGPAEGGVPAVPAEPGTPPAWGAGLRVSPFGTVNLLNGNLLTAIELTRWAPVGPGVRFALFHNSQSVAGTGGCGGLGFDLGAGWSASYGDRIVGSPGAASVTYVEDDGRPNVFRLQGGVYQPPPGVHDRLAWDAQAEQWSLTDPSQTQAIFDSDGRLLEIRDSAGNVVTVARDALHGGRIDYVASAADGLPNVGLNRLEFCYDEAGRLFSIVDPMQRTWTFEYEPGGSQRLTKIHYPWDVWVPPSFVEVEYKAGDAGRIQDFTSRDGKTWTYTYDGAGWLAAADQINLTRWIYGATAY